jgi:hypothetical protein
MSPVEASLRRLQNCFSDFVAMAPQLRDVDELKAQIELRRRALRDIKLVQIRLGTLLHEKKAPSCRLRSRIVRPSHVRAAHCAEHFRWQV